MSNVEINKNKEKIIKNIANFLKITFLFFIVLIWVVNIIIAISTYKTYYLPNDVVDVNNLYQIHFELLFILSFVIMGIIGISYFSFLIYTIKIKTFKILLWIFHIPFIFIFLLLLASEIFLFNRQLIHQLSSTFPNAYLSFFIIFIVFNFIFLMYIPLLIQNLKDYTFFSFYGFDSNVKFNKVDLSPTWLNFYYQIFFLIFILKLKSKEKTFYQVALYKNISVLNSFRLQRNVINKILNAIIFVLPIIVSSIIPLVSNHKIDSSTQIIFGVTLGSAISGLIGFLTWILNYNKKTFRINNFNNYYFKSLKQTEVFHESTNTKNDLLQANEKVSLELFNFYKMKKYDKTMFINSLLQFCNFKNYNSEWILLDEYKILEKFFYEEFKFFNANEDNIFFPYKIQTHHVELTMDLTKNDILFLIKSIKDYKEG